MAPYLAEVAQSVEQRTENPRVSSSILLLGTLLKQLQNEGALMFKGLGCHASTAMAGKKLFISCKAFFLTTAPALLIVAAIALPIFGNGRPCLAADQNFLLKPYLQLGFDGKKDSAGIDIVWFSEEAKHKWTLKCVTAAGKESEAEWITERMISLPGFTAPLLQSYRAYSQNHTRRHLRLQSFKRWKKGF